MGKKKILITIDSDAYDIYNSVPKGWRGALVSFAIKHLRKNRNAWKSFVNIAGMGGVEQPKGKEVEQKHKAGQGSVASAPKVKMEIERGWG